MQCAGKTKLAAPTAATDKVFTEADWADAETTDPLTKSIILAEKSAWDFVKELTDADKIDLCVMNPTLPLGPPLLDAQQDVVKMILDRGITGCPRVSYSLVDVRDVAAAHVKALALDVSGHRHILHGGNLWMKDIALALAKEYKPQGYSIHTMSLPNVALWGLSLFNKNAKTFLPIVGKQSQFDNTRMKDVLGISPKDVKETIMEEASVLIEKGLVKKPKRTRCQGGGAAAADNEAKTEETTEKKEGEGEDKPKENGDVKEEEAEKKEDQEESKGDGKVEEKKEEEAKSDADKAAVDEVKTEAPEESTEAKAEN
ncbi:reductase [Biomphalaria pfeifferi]|uniref:Reductase n=1 Tax=Biomphalaria pfeifferi TaxID=112525 RepID=A0AAD8FJB2_BIOPF|nr:reductase [Biomphalaria pfeifferi]